MRSRSGSNWRSKLTVNATSDAKRNHISWPHLQTRQDGKHMPSLKLKATSSCVLPLSDCWLNALKWAKWTYKLHLHFTLIIIKHTCPKSPKKFWELCFPQKQSCCVATSWNCPSVWHDMEMSHKSVLFNRTNCWWGVLREENIAESVYSLKFT